MHAAARRAAAKPSVSLLIAAVDRDPVRREVWLNETVEDLLHQHNLTAVEVLLLSLVPRPLEPLPIEPRHAAHSLRRGE